MPQAVTRSKRIERKTAINHVAVDLGGKESQICVRQPDGTIIEERKVPTRKLTELIARWTASRVVMETSAEAFKIADAAIGIDAGSVGERTPSTKRSSVVTNSDDGRWTMDDGRWTMDDGRWTMDGPTASSPA